MNPETAETLLAFCALLILLALTPIFFLILPAL